MERAMYEFTAVYEHEGVIFGWLSVCRESGLRTPDLCLVPKVRQYMLGIVAKSNSAACGQ